MANRGREVDERVFGRNRRSFLAIPILFPSQSSINLEIHYIGRQFNLRADEPFISAMERKSSRDVVRPTQSKLTFVDWVVIQLDDAD